MKYKFNISFAVVSVLTALFLCSSIHAQLVLGETIGIDFGSIAPVEGTNFNQFDAFTNSIEDGESLALSTLVTTIINTNGDEVTGLDFSVTNNTGQSTSRADVTVGQEGLGLIAEDASLFSDTLISNNTAAFPIGGNGVANMVLTFSGLDDDLSYNLTGGFDSNNANFNAMWSADGQSFSTDSAGPDSDLGFNNLLNLSTDGNGNLEITITRTVLHVTAAALTLEAVETPTPSSGLVFNIENASNGTDLVFSWVSEIGVTYGIRRTTDLSLDRSLWDNFASGIDADVSGLNLLVVPRPDELASFFDLMEEELSEQ